MITDDEAKAMLREMFRDGVLDPYPTSDEAPQYALAEWCGYNLHDEELAPPPE